MFQLRSDEADRALRSQNVISKFDRRGGNRYLPYAFTEQGIYMLMTVLHGKLAVEQSRALIRMFKAMKDYIVENQERMEYRNNLQLAMRVVNNTRDIEMVKNELGKLDAEVCKMNEKMGKAITKSDFPVIFDKMVDQREFLLLNDHGDSG